MGVWFNGHFAITVGNVPCLNIFNELLGPFPHNAYICGVPYYNKSTAFIFIKGELLLI